MLNPIKKYLLNNVLRAADDGAGGSGSGADAGGGGKSESLAAAAAAASGQQQQQQNGGGQNNGQEGGQQNGNVQLPEWTKGWPEHLVDPDPVKMLGKVKPALDGFRAQQAERGAVPKDITGYKFEPTDALKPFVEGFGEDELYTGILADFHEAGVTDAQFSKVMPKILERVLGTGNIAAPVNYDELVMTMVPETARTLDEQGQRQAAGKRISDALAFIDGIKAQKGVSDEVADYLVAQLGDDPKGIQALEFMQSLGNKAGPALGGNGGGGATDADLDARITDPRGDPNSPQFDRGFAAETDRLMQQKYGN